MSPWPWNHDPHAGLEHCECSTCRGSRAPARRMCTTDRDGLALDFGHAKRKRLDAATFKVRST